MKKLKSIKHEKEFDTMTIVTNIPMPDDAEELAASEVSSGSSKSRETQSSKIAVADTSRSSGSAHTTAHLNKTAQATEASVSNADSQDGSTPSASASVSSATETVNRKSLSGTYKESINGQPTQIYEPRPLTPEDDIYEDIIEQFASAPTKPKYWFEEFGDYWSCSCGHINKGDYCKSCGLERELLRSLFILHKPAGETGKLNKKLKKAKEQVDKEEQQHADKTSRRREREASGEDLTKVIPIEVDEPKAEDSGFSDNAEKNGESKSSHNTPDRKSSTDTDRKDTAGVNSGSDAETDEKQQPALLKKDSHSSVKKSGSGFKGKIAVAIIICLALIGACGFAIYKHMAAPAMQYEEAQQLQADGKYEQAIEKYTELGDYKDSKKMIIKCWVLIGDRYYEDGEFQNAINAYETAMDLKKDDSLYEKIRLCYIGIGDQYFKDGEFEKAIGIYTVAAEIAAGDDVVEKINAAKMGYVKAYQADRTDQVETYLDDLVSAGYSGAQELYDAYYAWHVSIVANTSEDDYSSDVDTVSRTDTVYFHASLSGGEPSESIALYYEISWPDGRSEIYDLDSNWKAGDKITARFQYAIPLFGKEGKLTFTLYDRNTKEAMGSDSVTFRH